MEIMFDNSITVIVLLLGIHLYDSEVSDRSNLAIVTKPNIFSILQQFSSQLDLYHSFPCPHFTGLVLHHSRHSCCFIASKMPCTIIKKSSSSWHQCANVCSEGSPGHGNLTLSSLDGRITLKTSKKIRKFSRESLTPASRWKGL